MNSEKTSIRAAVTAGFGVVFVVKFLLGFGIFVYETAFGITVSSEDKLFAFVYICFATIFTIFYDEFERLKKRVNQNRDKQDKQGDRENR